MRPLCGLNLCALNEPRLVCSRDYNYIIWIYYNIERDMGFFWLSCFGGFLVSAVMQAGAEIFFLLIFFFLLEWPLGSIWPHSQAEVGLSFGCWAQESRSRCSGSWSGGIPAARVSRDPSYLKWFQGLQEAWSKIKRSFKDRLDVENSSWLSKYPAEFLLEKNSMCKAVSFPDYEGWGTRERDFYFYDLRKRVGLKRFSQLESLLLRKGNKLL